MKTLILAGGFGVRLREMVHGRPKAMVPIDGQPFLEYLINLLKDNGIKDIVLGVGYLSDYIVDYFGNGKKWGVDISYSVDNRPLGTAGTIRYALKHFKKDFLVLNGDTYFMDLDFKEFIKFHKKEKADVTIAVARRFPGRGGRIILGKQKTVKDFKELKEEEEAGQSGYSNAGAYIFKPKVLKLLKKGERTSLEKDLFPLLIAEEHKLVAYPIKSYLDIGSPESYQEARRLLPKLEEK